jgi:hypothetical protein
MERLTTRAENGAAIYAEPSREEEKWTNNRYEVLQKLAKYEDLEEQGLLIELPCKIGTPVYFVDDKYTACDNCPRYDGEECDNQCEKTVKAIPFDIRMITFVGSSYYLKQEEAERELAEQN